MNWGWGGEGGGARLYGGRRGGPARRCTARDITAAAAVWGGLVPAAGWVGGGRGEGWWSPTAAGPPPRLPLSSGAAAYCAPPGVGGGGPTAAAGTRAAARTPPGGRSLTAPGGRGEQRREGWVRAVLFVHGGDKEKGERKGREGGGLEKTLVRRGRSTCREAWAGSGVGEGGVYLSVVGARGKEQPPVACRPRAVGRRCRRPPGRGHAAP